jgi:Photosynthesis system II assembly factor YCF48
MKSDRDQSIERLLRTLPGSGGGTSHDESCPDAETLAALADNTLLSAVRREIETHVADCDRCQMVTAALVRAESIPAGQTADVRAWKRRVVNWLVPAAAAATAVALWVIVPGQRSSLPEESGVDLRSAATAPPPAVANSQTGETLPGGDALKDQSPTALAETRLDRAIPSEAVPPSSADLSRRQIVGQPALKAEEARSAGAVAGGLQVPGAAAGARAEVAGGLQASGQSARNDAALREAAVQETVTVTEPGRSAASARTSPTALQDRVAGFEVASSNPQIRWRIGPGAVVQHSADGGATWTAQQTGPAAELTAGSSPSADVCWLVGRGGVVLRTTDGGRQWQRASLPQTGDIIAVTASNALNAVVSTADGRRLQTTDGGRTWVPAQ